MTQPEIQHLKIGITTQLFGKYLVSKRIGDGGFGAVFEVFKLNNPKKRYALKAEPMGLEKNEQFLKIEYKVITKLTATHAQHSVEVYHAGKKDNYSYLIMTLLGPSLSDLRKLVPDSKFSLYTTTYCLLQCIDAIREVHKAGFIHRDIKPSNFAVGRMNTDDRRWIYLLDFGLCRQCIYHENSHKSKRTSPLEEKNERLREPRRQAPMRGTIRYCSLSAHRKEEQGRHDDLWSLWYTVMEMWLGELPWNKKDKIETERIKMEIQDDLIHKAPREIGEMAKYLKTCTYKMAPDYALVRNLACQLFHKEKFSVDNPLDWEPGSKHTAIFQQMHKFKIQLDFKKPPPRTFVIDKITKEIRVKSVDMEIRDDENEGNSDPDDTLEGATELPSRKSESKKDRERRSKRSIDGPTRGTPEKDKEKKKTPDKVPEKNKEVDDKEHERRSLRILKQIYEQKRAEREKSKEKMSSDKEKKEKEKSNEKEKKGGRKEKENEKEKDNEKDNKQKDTELRHPEKMQSKEKVSSERNTKKAKAERKGSVMDMKKADKAQSKDKLIGGSAKSQTKVGKAEKKVEKEKGGKEGEIENKQKKKPADTSNDKNKKAKDTQNKDKDAAKQADSVKSGKKGKKADEHCRNKDEETQKSSCD